MSKSSGPLAEEWDLIIQPKTGWLDLHLADLWRYRDLTMLFVWRDFVAQYKQTILCPLWHIVQPLITTTIFTIIFGKLAKLSTDDLPPLLFYMAGVTCWSYFADCVNRTSMTFISNAAIFGKVYFPRLSVPVSIVISSMIKFAISSRSSSGSSSFTGCKAPEFIRMRLVHLLLCYFFLLQVSALVQ